MESLGFLDHGSSAFTELVKYLYTTATAYGGRSDGRTDGRGIAVSSPQMVAKYPSSYGILILSRRQDSNLRPQAYETCKLTICSTPL